MRFWNFFMFICFGLDVQKNYLIVFYHFGSEETEKGKEKKIKSLLFPKKI